MSEDMSASIINRLLRNKQNPMKESTEESPELKKVRRLNKTADNEVVREVKGSGQSGKFSHKFQFDEPLIEELLPDEEEEDTSLIRPEHTPVSTSTKPNISESVGEFSDFSNMQKLKGKSWTRIEDLVDSIEKLEYDVIYYSKEYVSIMDPLSSDNKEMYVPVSKNGNILTLNLSKSYVE